MKNIILFATTLLIAACSTSSKIGRKISSVGVDLTGTYLGVAEYGKGHKGPKKPAIRIYFHPVEGQVGKYNVVLLEYVNLLKMAPSYIVSNKLPLIANKTGYLHNISSKIYTYEAIPGEIENTFELRPLVIRGDNIEVNLDVTPRILTLAKGASTKNPLSGATISQATKEQPNEIFFPGKDDGKKKGIQFRMAKLAYEKAKLESTWRKSFLKGNYLSQYYNKKDVVLKLRDDNAMEFFLNPKYSKIKPEKRAKMFTSEKSAYLKGNFVVTEPRDGMFLAHSVDSDENSKEILEGRIGMFIDIFDATKSLNQDVVELVFINPNDPSDFLMYYEHPDNGEGTDSALLEADRK